MISPVTPPGLIEGRQRCWSRSRSRLISPVTPPGAGLVRAAPKRSAHRKKRARRPLVSRMLHEGLPLRKRGMRRALPVFRGWAAIQVVVALDDAASAIDSVFPVEEEGTVSSFRGVADVIARHGLFCELYTDRGSYCFHTPTAGEAVSKRAHTPKAAEAVSKRVHTQVGRALAQLGIRHIGPYSPEACAATSVPSAPCRTVCRRS